VGFLLPKPAPIIIQQTPGQAGGPPTPPEPPSPMATPSARSPAQSMRTRATSFLGAAQSTNRPASPMYGEGFGPTPGFGAKTLLGQ
jgi:hypothetical protein